MGIDKSGDQTETALFQRIYIKIKLFKNINPGLLAIAQIIGIIDVIKGIQLKMPDFEIGNTTCFNSHKL